MSTDFTLPELGENIRAGDVIKVNVAVGQRVAKEQPVLELETDKAVIEVPSSVAGVVTAVHVKVGDKAQIGQAVFTVDGADAPQAIVKTAPVAIEQAAPKIPVQAPSTKESETPPVARQEIAVASDEAVRVVVPQRGVSEPVLAAPSVRKLAREIGIDIDMVAASGPHGRVTVEDVKATARRASADNGGFVAGKTLGNVIPPIELPDFTKFGAVERKAMTNVRRRTAERMSAAWLNIPHVTQHDDADITELENLRKQFGKRAESAGGSLTITVIVLKIVASALKVFPHFNASLDMAAQEIITKKYYNIGVAVDTDRGLIVPVIKDVDKKNIVQLSRELTEAAEKARSKKTSLEEMQGGSFTITNLGGIGGGYFTPIINPPEVAILGLGRWRYQQVYVDGKFEARKMLPLSLSYDHRIIDGADAARFLRWIVDAVNQPFLMDLEG